MEPWPNSSSNPSPDLAATTWGNNPSYDPSYDRSSSTPSSQSNNNSYMVLPLAPQQDIHSVYSPQHDQYPQASPSPSPPPQQQQQQQQQSTTYMSTTSFQPDAAEFMPQKVLYDGMVEKQRSVTRSEQYTHQHQHQHRHQYQYQHENENENERHHAHQHPRQQHHQQEQTKGDHQHQHQHQHQSSHHYGSTNPEMIGNTKYNNVPDVDPNAIYVNNLDESTTEREILECFSPFGIISDFNIYYKRGFLFLWYADPNSVETALQYNGTLNLRGKNLFVRRKKRPKQSNSVNNNSRDSYYAGNHQYHPKSYNNDNNRHYNDSSHYHNDNSHYHNDSSKSYLSHNSNGDNRHGGNNTFAPYHPSMNYTNHRGQQNRGSRKQHGYRSASRYDSGNHRQEVQPLGSKRQGGGEYHSYRSNNGSRHHHEQNNNYHSSNNAGYDNANHEGYQEHHNGGNRYHQSGGGERNPKRIDVKLLHENLKVTKAFDSAGVALLLDDCVHSSPGCFSNDRILPKVLSQLARAKRLHTCLHIISWCEENSGRMDPITHQPILIINTYCK